MFVDRIETVGEADVVVSLPEGDYAAHAVITDRWTDTDRGRVGEQRRIKITMLDGEKIPIGGQERAILDYTVIAKDLEVAVQNLISHVQSSRAGNHFTSSQTTRRPRLAPRTTSRQVRMKRADGTVIEVPATTRAIPLAIDPTKTGYCAPIPLSDKLRESFDVLALPVDQLRGRRVLYTPSPDSTEGHEAEIEPDIEEAQGTSK